MFPVFFLFKTITYVHYAQFTVCIGNVMEYSRAVLTSFKCICFCRWVNAAPCDSCGRETSNVGMGNPLPSEIEFGASRVELYR
jgi:hypothetical protein